MQNGMNLSKKQRQIMSVGDCPYLALKAKCLTHQGEDLKFDPWAFFLSWQLIIQPSTKFSETAFPT